MVALHKVEERLKAAVASIGRPACYEDKIQYKEWLFVEAQAHTQRFRKDVCEDCTKGFKTVMVAAGRCVNPRFVPSE